MQTLTPEQKRTRIKELERDYLSRIESLRQEYRSEIRRIMQNIEKKKVEAVRKKLKVSK